MLNETATVGGIIFLPACSMMLETSCFPGSESFSASWKMWRRKRLLGSEKSNTEMNGSRQRHKNKGIGILDTEWQ